MTDVPDVYHDLRPAKEFALFGEASYDVLDNLTATLGLRYYNNKTSFEQDTISVFSGFKQVAKLTPTSTESGVAPKYLIQYSPSNDIMIYSSASKGFRIGGNNIFLPPTCDADLAAINLTRDGVAAYKSDSLWDYDVSVKSTLADRRGTLNLAGFDIEWDKN